MRYTPGSARSVIAGLPAVDINLLPDMLSARPKLAQLVRF